MINDSVTSFYINSNCTRGGEDLITWGTVEPLCRTFETNVKLCIINTSIDKKEIKTEPIKTEVFWLIRT